MAQVNGCLRRNLKRHQHAEQRLAVLLRHHLPKREGTSVPCPVNGNVERLMDIPRPQEITVQRVHGTAVAQRLLCCREALCQELTAVEAIAFVRRGRCHEPVRRRIFQRHQRFEHEIASTAASATC
jgi:hypothetical protein